MKPTVLILVIFVISFLNLAGQNNDKKIKVYSIKIKTMENQTIEGFLFKADSLGLTVSKDPKFESEDPYFISAANIKNIKFRRRGAVARGAGYGFLSGAAVGVIAGYASDDGGGSFIDDDTVAVGGGMILGILGAGTGALIGTSRKKMIIEGRETMYHLKLPLLLGYMSGSQKP